LAEGPASELKLWCNLALLRSMHLTQQQPCWLATLSCVLPRTGVEMAPDKQSRRHTSHRLFIEIRVNKRLTQVRLFGNDSIQATDVGLAHKFILEERLYISDADTAEIEVRARIRLEDAGEGTRQAESFTAASSERLLWTHYVRPECEYAAQLAGAAAANHKQEPSLSLERGEWQTWLSAYSKFHERIVDGKCASRYLVFEAAGDKGLGNKMMGLSSALLAAMLTGASYTYIYTCIYVYLYTYIHTYIHTYVHTYIHTYMHACIHTYIIYIMYVCMDTYIIYKKVYICIHISIYIYIFCR